MKYDYELYYNSGNYQIVQLTIYGDDITSRACIDSYTELDKALEKLYSLKSTLGEYNPFGVKLA